MEQAKIFSKKIHAFIATEDNEASSWAVLKTSLCWQNKLIVPNLHQREGKNIWISSENLRLWCYWWAGIPKIFDFDVSSSQQYGRPAVATSLFDQI
jgi:hypothetical protein